MQYLSTRVKSTMAPPLVDLGELASRTRNCISLGQGVPYYYPSTKIFDAFSQDLENNTYHRYSPDPGIIELRKAIIKKLATDYNLSSSPDQIVVTPGANQAFFNILLSITDPGDNIILLTPYYFNHQMAASLTNVEIKTVPLNRDFSIPNEKIKTVIDDSTKAIVLVNPGNPSGIVHNKHEIKKIIDLAENNNIWLIADETYEYFTYNGSTHTSIAQFQNASKTILIGSFSKTFGIPGWRLGYYHGPRYLITESIKIQDTIGICAPTPSQYLGLLLLQQRDRLLPQFVSLMEANYNISRDLIDDVSWLEPTESSGAYYLFPTQSTGINTVKLVKSLITEYKVYVVPGFGFGENWANNIRISFANTTPEELKEAFRRLRNYTI